MTSWFIPTVATTARACGESNACSRLPAPSARHGAGHNKRVKLVRAAPPFYVVRWPAIFPGTFKVDSSEMSPCTLNSGGGAPGRFPAASTPMAGNNMRQWDQGALRNAQEGVVYIPAVVHHLVR